MPFWDRLRRNRDRNSTPAADNASAATTNTNTTTDAARTSNYANGRDAVRPPATTAPAAAPAEAPAAEPEGPQGTQTLRMPEGTRYSVTADDIGYSKEGTLDKIAKKHGMIGWRIAQANEDVADVQEGTQLYLPSTEELLYADCVRKTQDHDKAATMYGEVAQSGGLAIVKGARAAASGDAGESYGTSGVEGKFLASNPALAGASERRTTTENGQKLYKISWLSNFWKCNLFANEAVYRGGYEPSMKANKHYTTAGALHLDKKSYQEVPASSAYAGCVVTLTAGTGSDQSHSGVCGNMPILTTDEDGNTVVEFTFIGASTDRAKEQDKKITIKAGTNEIVSGDSHDNLRFLKAVKKR